MRNLWVSILSVMMMVVFCSSSSAVLINQGPINVPEIAPITVDGSLGDWAAASTSLTFGAWYVDGAGIASTTTAQYAWSDTANKLYVGITSTEGAGAILEVGGLSITGSAIPIGGIAATQYELQFDGSGAVSSINNQPGGPTSNVTVVSTLSGGSLVVEMEISIKTDYSDIGGGVTLAEGLTIYEYSDIFSPGWAGGDHQNFEDEYITSFRTALNAFATQLLLGPTPPSAIPGDFDEDNDVDGVDFGLWQTGYPTASGASLVNGDADGDGDVDGVDFGIWQENYPTNLGGATTTPEPATLGLLLIGGLALLRRRRS